MVPTEAETLPAAWRRKAAAAFLLLEGNNESSSSGGVQRDEAFDLGAPLLAAKRRGSAAAGSTRNGSSSGDAALRRGSIPCAASTEAWGRKERKNGARGRRSSEMMKLKEQRGCREEEATALSLSSCFAAGGVLFAAEREASLLAASREGTPPEGAATAGGGGGFGAAAGRPAGENTSFSSFPGLSRAARGSSFPLGSAPVGGMLRRWWWWCGQERGRRPRRRGLPPTTAFNIADFTTHGSGISPKPDRSWSPSSCPPTCPGPGTPPRQKDGRLLVSDQDEDGNELTNAWLKLEKPSAVLRYTDFVSKLWVAKDESYCGEDVGISNSHGIKYPKPWIHPSFVFKTKLKAVHLQLYDVSDREEEETRKRIWDVYFSGGSGGPFTVTNDAVPAGTSLNRKGNVMKFGEICQPLPKHPRYRLDITRTDFYPDDGEFLETVYFSPKNAGVSLNGGPANLNADVDAMDARGKLWPGALDAEGQEAPRLPHLVNTKLEDLPTSGRFFPIDFGFSNVSKPNPMLLS